MSNASRYHVIFLKLNQFKNHARQNFDTATVFAL